jgi:uncharacterized damage-inducible protein DinB
MLSFVRTLLAAITMCLFAWPCAAQQAATQVPITAPLEKQYVGDLSVIHDKILALANAIPADKYEWRPSDKVRTVSQVFTHMAGEWFYLCPLSVGAKPPADFSPPGEAMRKLEAITTKPEVIAQLIKAWDHCRSALDAIDPTRLVPDSLPAKMGFPRVVLLVLGDQHEHVGQLIAYARSIGVAPPWSK